MPGNPLVIRDFIYLDVERLYSLFSQVFEGVTEQITESQSAHEANTNTQKGTIGSGSSAEAQVAEASMRTQHKFLYDHMYSLLEERLSEAITSTEQINPHNYWELLSDTFLVKARGAAEIHDYERLRQFLRQFNSLGEALSAMQLRCDNPEAAIKQYEALAKSTQDPEERANYSLMAKWIRQPKEYAKQIGLQNDEKFLSSMELVLQGFYESGMDFVVSSPSKEVAFRAVLDKKLLRLDSNYFRMLHGARAIANWTVVGEVTHIPHLAEGEQAHPPSPKADAEGGADQESPVVCPDESTSANQGASQMRDSLALMFQVISNLERKFFDTSGHVEITVRPLAIYRERQVHVS